MPAYVSFIRGINVGGHAMLPMAKLKAAHEELGFEDVRTHLQSGNVVFTPKGKGDHALRLSKAIEQETGHEVAVLVRTGGELARVVEANPYTVSDPTKVVVAFLGEELELGQLGLGDLGPYLPDELTLHGREIYVSVPNGQGRSKLMETLVKRGLPTTITVRNWRTVEALTRMAAGARG